MVGFIEQARSIYIIELFPEVRHRELLPLSVHHQLCWEACSENLEEDNKFILTWSLPTWLRDFTRDNMPRSTQGPAVAPVGQAFTPTQSEAQAWAEEFVP